MLLNRDVMSDPIHIAEAARQVLEDLSRSRHPTARRPWLSIKQPENANGESEGESDSPLPAVDLLVG